MVTSKTKDATGKKSDSKESDTVQESLSEASKPEEPSAATLAEEKAQAKEKTKTEEQSKDKTKAKAKIEAKAKAEAETEEENKAEAEKTESEAEPETEVKTEAVVEEKGKPEAEVKVEPEEKAETEDKTTVPEHSQESAKGGVSETIEKMTQSPAVLPGESGKSTVVNISVSSILCAKDIMQQKAAWANSEDSVQQALATMQQQDSGYIMIGKDGALEGIVSKSDIKGATSIYLRPIFAK